MDEQLKSNLLSKKHWMRLLYMVFFAVLFYVAFLVIWLVVAVQFVFALITGNDNDNVRKFGSSLSQFISQTTQFLTYNSEEKPFPFSDWPEPVVLVSAHDIEDSSNSPVAPAEVEDKKEKEHVELVSKDDSSSNEENSKANKGSDSESVVEDSISESEKQLDVDSSDAQSTDSDVTDSSAADNKAKKPRATRKKTSASTKKSSPGDA